MLDGLAVLVICSVGGSPAEKKSSYFQPGPDVYDKDAELSVAIREMINL
jgi:hypothetical protein